MPFGVDLPDNLGAADSAPVQDTAPEGATPDTVSTDAKATEAPDSKAQALIDLDKAERFRFEGREWTREELRRAYLRQQDYSRKTQELSKTREEITRDKQFSDNFSFDLKTLIREPHRFADFQRIYPKAYVERATEILQELGKLPQSQTQGVSKAQDPEFQALKSEFEQLKAEREAQAIEQINAWLDHQHALLGKKYSFADKEVVEARATALAERGTKITQELLDKLYKASNDEIKGRWEAHYKALNTKQLKNGEKARDMGPGGGTPTGAPRTPKTIKEATALAMEDLKSKGLAR